MIGKRIGSIRQLDWHETSTFPRVKIDEIFSDITEYDRENSKVWTRIWAMEY